MNDENKEGRDIYGNVRATDLRHEFPHMLAEYVGAAQRLVDTAKSAHADSKKLLAGAVAIVRDSEKNHQTRTQDALDTLAYGADQVKAATVELVVQVGHAHDTGVVAIVRAFDACIDVVEKVGNDIERQLGGPAQVIEQAAASLAARALKADADHVVALAERMKLVDYMAKLEAYKLELNAYERDVTKRCAAARSKAMTGTSFWARVFAPPAVVIDLPKAPLRPKQPAASVREPKS